MRSSWRSAARTSPRSAKARATSTLACSSAGCSVSSSSQRPARRSSSPCRVSSDSRCTSVHVSYTSSGNSGPAYIARASAAFSVDPSTRAASAACRKATASTTTSASGSSVTTSLRRTTVPARSPRARRAKCAALCSLGPAASSPRSGQRASITCSRCMRRPLASASSLTSALAWRRLQAASGTATPSTVTENPPSMSMRTCIRMARSRGDAVTLLRRPPGVSWIHAVHTGVVARSGSASRASTSSVIAELTSRSSLRMSVMSQS